MPQGPRVVHDGIPETAVLEGRVRILLLLIGPVVRCPVLAVWRWLPLQSQLLLLELLQRALRPIQGLLLDPQHLLPVAPPVWGLHQGDVQDRHGLHGPNDTVTFDFTREGSQFEECHIRADLAAQPPKQHRRGLVAPDKELEVPRRAVRAEDVVVGHLLHRLVQLLLVEDDAPIQEIVRLPLFQLRAQPTSRHRERVLDVRPPSRPQSRPLVNLGILLHQRLIRRPAEALPVEYRLVEELITGPSLSRLLLCQFHHQHASFPTRIANVSLYGERAACTIDLFPKLPVHGIQRRAQILRLAPNGQLVLGDADLQVLLGDAGPGVGVQRQKELHGANEVHPEHVPLHAPLRLHRLVAQPEDG
mmetsp:Transcript_73064/g.237644  ORF Transcript_73064/g.237644 Transcript_73064/m.237644 type:complete len:360 (+) Transcript_73064:352-1431(+)